MNSRHTIVLLACLLLAGAGYWLAENHPWVANPASSADQARPLDPLRMFTVLLPEVQAVVVEDLESGSRARVERGNGRTWWLAEPERKELDTDKMINMVMTLTSLAAERALTDTAVIDSFGLSRPVLTLQILGQNGGQVLDVGAPTPIGGAYYARRRDNGALFLLPAKTLGELRQLIAWLPTAAPPPSPVPRVTGASAD